MFGAGNLCQHSWFDAPNLADVCFMVFQEGLSPCPLIMSSHDHQGCHHLDVLLIKCSHSFVQLITPFMLVLPGCLQCSCQPCPINLVVCVFRHSIKWWICYLQNEPGIIGSVVTHVVCQGEIAEHRNVQPSIGTCAYVYPAYVQNVNPCSTLSQKGTITSLPTLRRVEAFITLVSRVCSLTPWMVRSWISRLLVRCTAWLGRVFCPPCCISHRLLEKGISSYIYNYIYIST